MPSHFLPCELVLLWVDIRELKAWFPCGCICRVRRTKKIHRTDRIHSISYNKFYLSFLLYWAFVREVSIKLYLSYEFFSYDWHDRYNDMETRLKQPRRQRQQERHNFAYLTMKNNDFERVFFADVGVLSTTRNDLFCGCVDDVSILWQMFNFVFLFLKRRFQVNFHDS